MLGNSTGELERCHFDNPMSQQAQNPKQYDCHVASFVFAVREGITGLANFGEGLDVTVA